MKKFIGDLNTVLLLTPEEAEEICHLGQGEKACPWLVGRTGLECFRMNYPSNLAIGKRIKEGTMTAKGDACNWEETSSKA